MADSSCPSCGAPVEKKTVGAILLVCPYCDSTLMQQGQALEDVGKMAVLQEDGSPLQLGCRGTYLRVPFTVVGRIQLEYALGYWNEWYVSFDDGQTGWLGEGQGQYTFTRLVPAGSEVPPHDSLRPGHSVRLNLGGEPQYLQVLEVSQARCISGAGELPFSIQTGYDAPVADLAGSGRRFATLDYSESPPLAFLGERVTFESLELTGLREFEGW